MVSCLLTNLLQEACSVYTVISSTTPFAVVLGLPAAPAGGRGGDGLEAKSTCHIGEQKSPDPSPPVIGHMFGHRIVHILFLF